MAAAGERTRQRVLRRSGPPDPSDEDFVEGRDSPVDAVRFLDRRSAVRSRRSLPLVDHRDVIGDLLHLVQQVRRKEHRAAFIGDGANHGAENVAANDGIEAGRRFVQHQQFGPVRQRDRAVPAAPSAPWRAS